MSAEEYIYEYDETGSSPDNLIPAEQHTLTAANGDNYFLIMPRVAPYFKTSMIVTHVDTGTILKPGVDFICTHQFLAASDALNKLVEDQENPPCMDVFGSVTILNRKLSGNFSLEYQTLGGDFIFDEKNLLTKLTILMQYPDTRTWEDITAVPKYFPPKQHETHIDDLVGMDAVVKAVDELKIAVMGLGEGNHMHPITHIKGLQTILEGLADNSGNHKVAVGDGYTYIGHTGAMAILLPEFQLETQVQVKATLLSDKEPTEFEFSGVVAGKDTAQTGNDWGSPVVNFEGYEHTKNIRMSYDLEDRPVIYIGDDEYWHNCTLVITSVTIDGSLPENYVLGWETMPVTDVYGDTLPTVDVGTEELKADVANTGTLKPWTIWLVNSNQERIRYLPSADVEDGAEITIRDSVGLCYHNNCTIQGNIEDQADLILNRNMAWVTLKWIAGLNTWKIIDGHAGSRFKGLGGDPEDLPPPEDPNAPVAAVKELDIKVTSSDVTIDGSAAKTIVKRLSTSTADILLKDTCPVGTLVEVDNVLSNAGTVSFTSETGQVFFEELPSGHYQQLSGKGTVELIKVDSVNWTITDLRD